MPKTVDVREASSPSAIPPEETKRANPVKATLASIADGKKMYVTQCAMCHGAGGDGKGDLAADMNDRGLLGALDDLASSRHYEVTAVIARQPTGPVKPLP